VVLQGERDEMVCYVRQPGEAWRVGEEAHQRAYARFRQYAVDGVLEDIFIAGDVMRLGTLRAITNERAEFVSRNGQYRLELYSYQMPLEGR
jgi:hypothetical protein